MVKAYSQKLADASLFGFCRILFLWTGSIYKLIMWEFFIYFSIFIIYWSVMRFFLVPRGYDDYIKKYTDPLVPATEAIPLEFLLGFYVAYVSNRWWEQFRAIPWIDRIAALVRVGIRENPNSPELDLDVKEARRKIVRYMVLGEAWLYRDICPAFEKKLKTEEDILKLGLATKEELKRLKCPSVQHSLYFLPYVWASEILLAINKKGCTFPPLVRDILRYIQEHRDGVELMYKYYTVPVPLCYTQVVSLAVYGYFFFALFTQDNGHYIPIALFVRFFVYFGWLKVAESLICPYGDNDDNDFDMVYMLHRNLQVGFATMCDSLVAAPPSGNDNDTHDEERYDMDSEEEITPRLSPVLFAQNGCKNKRIRTITNKDDSIKVNSVLEEALQDPEISQLLDDMKDEILIDLPPVTANILDHQMIPKVKNKHKTQILNDFKAMNGLVHKAADKYANRKVYLFDVGSKDFVKLRNLQNKRRHRKSPSEEREESSSFIYEDQSQNTPPVPPRMMPLSPLISEPTSPPAPAQKKSSNESSDNNKDDPSNSNKPRKSKTNYESLV